MILFSPELFEFAHCTRHCKSKSPDCQFGISPDPRCGYTYHMKPTVAVYFHPETIKTSAAADSFEWVGHSLPYIGRISAGIRSGTDLPELPLNRVPFDEFRAVHDERYLRGITNRAKGIQEPEIRISMECRNLWMAIPGYEFGLGGLYSAIDQMKKGILDRAYCGVLPSHHAYTARGHGYCMVNSLAAAVRYARKVGFQKALILDWDHHHGDGTQEIFTDDPDVYQISVHSGFDLYMASQKVLEAGLEPAGRKAGHRNIPILEEMLSDDFYYGELGYSGRIYRSHNALYAFGDALEELPWCPDIIFIFDGHDAHRDDCGAEVSRWDDDDFRTLSRLAMKAARTHSCPVVSMPGGGYVPGISIRLGILHLEELSK
jgi:acetoin utilization deacetylase AcuC-like enzyme